MPGWRCSDDPLSTHRRALSKGLCSCGCNLLDVRHPPLIFLGAIRLWRFDKYLPLARGRNEVSKTQKILTQLLETLNTPSLWGNNLKLKVPDTGLFSFGKYTIGEINSDFVKYLTDGKLRITFKLEPNDAKRAAADTFCYSTFTANDIAIALHQGAGSWRSKTAPYSDYDLAITIYHELLHVWQFHHEAMPSCYILTKEIPSYFLEKYLPKICLTPLHAPIPSAQRRFSAR